MYKSTTRLILLTALFNCRVRPKKFSLNQQSPMKWTKRKAKEK